MTRRRDNHGRALSSVTSRRGAAEPPTGERTMKNVTARRRSVPVFLRLPSVLHNQHGHSQHCHGPARSHENVSGRSPWFSMTYTTAGVLADGVPTARSVVVVALAQGAAVQGSAEIMSSTLPGRQRRRCWRPCGRSRRRWSSTCWRGPAGRRLLWRRARLGPSGGHGLAEGVRGDPVEAGGGEGFP